MMRTNIQKVESPGLPTEAFVKHSSNTSNYPIEQRAGKASPTLKAQFARAGHIVHDGGNDDYIVHAEKFSFKTRQEKQAAS